MPKSSTPALFEIHVRPVTPVLSSAEILFSGMPQRPNQPNINTELSSISFTASSAPLITLFIILYVVKPGWLFFYLLVAALLTVQYLRT